MAILTPQKYKKLYLQAVDNYARKMRFEYGFMREVNSLFKGLIKDFKANYVKYGSALSLNDFQKDIEELISKHHIKVSLDFSDSFRKIVGKPSNEKLIERKLEANIKGMAAQRAHLMSHTIADTTRFNIEKSVKDATVELAIKEAEITDKAIARMAGNYLDDKFISRSSTIGITETQFAAESGKVLEIDTLKDFDAEIDDEPVKEMTRQKIWIAILDDHTREAHAEADSQIVDYEDPFDVGGEELMYPGDDSMGASEGNIINCRCDSEIILGD
jgi:hypothetical protein